MGAGAALVSSQPNLRYLAGYEAPIEWGASPFAPCSSLLVLIPGRPPELLLAEGEALDPVPSGLVVSRFPGYTFREPTDTQAALCSCVIERLKGISRALLAVETAHLPAAQLLAINKSISPSCVVDLSAELAAMRAIKDPAEIRILREAVRLTDVGQSAACEAAKAGISEIEMFGEIRRAMEQAAGERLPILADLISGSRSAETGGSPGNRILSEGEMVIVDLAPRFKGMWGDSCNTLVIGHATSAQNRLLDQVAEVLAGLIKRVRPGMTACELDAIARAKIANLGGAYEHHTGHGLGASWHEEPRIVPYNTMELKPGMVLALEPAIYFEGQFGVRLESVVLVTEDGADVLTGFKHRP
jgi:Xaa-Pro aminopeptidase